jgi:hypothetical protein
LLLASFWPCMMGRYCSPGQAAKLPLSWLAPKSSLQNSVHLDQHRAKSLCATSCQPYATNVELRLPMFGGMVPVNALFARYLEQLPIGVPYQTLVNCVYATIPTACACACNHWVVNIHVLDSCEVANVLWKTTRQFVVVQVSKHMHGT